MIWCNYEVTLVYEDEAPEPFGHVSLDHTPKVGEIIQLRWLDNSPAFKAEVVRVREDRLMLDAKRLETKE